MLMGQKRARTRVAEEAGRADGAEVCQADGAEVSRADGAEACRMWGGGMPGLGLGAGRDEGRRRAGTWGVGPSCRADGVEAGRGYFCQLEFIHPSDIAICRIEGSRHSSDCKTIISCLSPFETFCFKNWAQIHLRNESFTHNLNSTPLFSNKIRPIA